MTSSHILQQLQALGSEQTRKTYARHGITGNVYGVSFANLGALKKQIKQNHELAHQIWQSGNFDARCLALMIAEPAHITRPELEQWISDVDNTALAYQLAGYIQKQPMLKSSRVFSLHLIMSNGQSLAGQFLLHWRSTIPNCPIRTLKLILCLYSQPFKSAKMIPSMS